MGSLPPGCTNDAKQHPEARACRRIHVAPKNILAPWIPCTCTFTKFTKPRKAHGARRTCTVYVRYRLHPFPARSANKVKSYSTTWALDTWKRSLARYECFHQAWTKMLSFLKYTPHTGSG